MLYNAYELQRLWFAGASAWADASAEWLNNPSNPLSYSAMGPLVASALDVFAHASAPRGKPAFGFTSVMVGGEVYPVEEEVVLRKPFGQLKRSEEHTSELKSLMRISYAVFCLKKKNKHQ